jgi:hypothetical protein
MIAKLLSVAQSCLHEPLWCAEAAELGNAAMSAATTAATQALFLITDTSSGRYPSFYLRGGALV